MNKKTKKLISNIGWLIFDKVFIMVINMVIIFVVANHYGASKYGIFQYATSIVLVLEVVVQLIDGRVVKKQYCKDNFEKVVFNVTVGKVFLSLIALAIGAMVSSFFTKGIDFTIIFYILLLDSIIRNLRFGMENRFEYCLLSKNVVIASNIGLSIGLFCQIIAVYLSWNIIAIAVIQMIASTISFFILKSQYDKEYTCFGKRKSVDYVFIKTILKESFPLAIAAASAVIYTRCDSIMLGTMLSTKEVGIYSISTRLISALQMLIVPVQTSIFVKMINWYGTSEYEGKYILVTSLCTWISLFGIVCSILVLPVIFRFLKPEYLPAMESYKILTIGSFFAYNAVLRSSHLTLSHDGKILMITQVITAILNILLNYFFIQIWGMNGAAMATAISQFISLFLSNILYKNTRFVLVAQIKGLNPLYFIRVITNNNK